MNSKKLMRDINTIYQEIDKCKDDYKKKGDLGETAVFRICEELYKAEGGILYHSFQHKVDADLPGNLKRSEQGNIFIENLGNFTEIDVLLVTPLRLFPIEVKTYSAVKNGGIVLSKDGISGCRETAKSPVHQNEMHCRHLYSYIYKNLPEGSAKFIQPIVVFVDRCKVTDNRSTQEKEYIPATTLNGLYSLLIQLNKPLGYKLDLVNLASTLNECCQGYNKMLPLKILEGL